jgi:hypothetical protein
VVSLGRGAFSRYLGPDQQRWDTDRFTLDEADAEFVRLVPDRIDALDLSFHPSARPIR